MFGYNDEYLTNVLLAYKNNNFDKSAAARAFGLARSTYRDALRVAKERFPNFTDTKVTAPTPAEPNPDALYELQSIKAQLASAKQDTLTDEYIKRKIFKLAGSHVDVPDWVIDLPDNSSGTPGVPTLFASDWHWSEVVDPEQIGGVNEYNIEIAHRRVNTLIATAIDLLANHMVNPNYPGIVFPLGGDMITGNIHEELIATNEIDIMPTLLDLFGVLVWSINTLAEEFGNVFVPCVTGNHGRNTHKIRAKNRNFTSFDWLVYCFLAKHFENDERVKFLIPNGPDATYRIYDHKYLLTHGDQFRGGDGMIGALGPIIRGDHKKRSRQTQVDSPYDTLLLGHWHQLIQLQRLIVNGSLIGYNEYAYNGNFSFEVPRQALWLTHPTHGITFSMPVNVDRAHKKHISSDWISWRP